MEDINKKTTWPEGKCPLESQVVVCGQCESIHFSIDQYSPRSNTKIPGTCDECGYRFGKKITTL